MMLLLLLYLKDMLFIALFSNIYGGEHFYENHLNLKFIPTIKTNKCLYIYMIELWLTIQLKFIPTIKTVKATYIKVWARCAYIKCTHT